MHRGTKKRRVKWSGKKKRSHLSPQLTFPWQQRDGHRTGRKKKTAEEKDTRIPHRKREEFASRHPVHVVLKLREDAPGLRSKKPYQVLRRAFAAGCDRFGFRLNHYSVQGDHLHLIVEADDRVALSRGLNGLTIRIAKGLNKLWNRRGRLFADRYFDRILKTPREVKIALEYVFKNSEHHGTSIERRPDIFSSGMWFDGWVDLRLEEFEASEPPPLVAARTWLQRVGWRRHGLIPFPGAKN